MTAIKPFSCRHYRPVAEKDKDVDREVEALTGELRDLTETEITRCRRERRSTDAIAVELQAAREAIEKDRAKVDREKASLARCETPFGFSESGADVGGFDRDIKLVKQVVRPAFSCFSSAI